MFKPPHPSSLPITTVEILFLTNDSSTVVGFSSDLKDQSEIADEAIEYVYYLRNNVEAIAGQETVNDMPQIIDVVQNTKQKVGSSYVYRASEGTYVVTFT